VQKEKKECNEALELNDDNNINNIEVFVDGTDIVYRGQILNINSRAMVFMCDDEIKDDKIYFFSFVLPNLEKLKNIKGKIARQEKFGAKYLTILTFFNIPKVEMLAIYRYIETSDEKC
jgi:hypothetical protein